MLSYPLRSPVPKFAGLAHPRHQLVVQRQLPRLTVEEKERSNVHPGSSPSADSLVRRVDSLDIPFRGICVRERLVYCPSQNRTCGFPASGSSSSLRLPVPDIRRQMRLFHIIVPDTQKLRIFQLSLLVTAVQHAVGGVFQILLKALYRVEIPAYPIVVAVSADDCSQ